VTERRPYPDHFEPPATYAVSIPSRNQEPSMTHPERAASAFELRFQPLSAPIAH
jgi:hypothetical protein